MPYITVPNHNKNACISQRVLLIMFLFSIPWVFFCQGGCVNSHNSVYESCIKQSGWYFSIFYAKTSTYALYQDWIDQGGNM